MNAIVRKILPGVAIALGFGASFWLGLSVADRQTVAPTQEMGQAEKVRQIWTCSMHPQVRLDRPGNCPICSMPLIPANAASSSGGMPTLALSEHALAMAGVETTPVARQAFSHELRVVGKIQYNEATLGTVTARVDGYAEKVFADVTGVEVMAGDHLAEVYSPVLLVAQQELLMMSLHEKSGPMIDATKLKLRRWGLAESQINDLIESKKVTDRITLLSPITGTIIEKNIIENSSFKAGDALYRVANLDTVWATLDVYESDFAWVRYGQMVEITSEACPGKTFQGMVTFVEPILDETTRTIEVPIQIENPKHELKPGMYVSADIKGKLGPDGLPAPTGAEGKYTCPMHPHVVADAAGACPLCGMPLKRIPGAPEASPAKAQAQQYACPMKCEGEKTYDKPGSCPVCNMDLKPVASAGQASAGLVAVPVSAVLDSGTRKIVYVEKGRGTFEPREVTLGPRCGDFFPVLKGLAEGERVATRGGFLIDSQFQITGHPSLFYPGGLDASMSPPDEGTGPELPSGQPMPGETAAPPAAGHKH